METFPRYWPFVHTGEFPAQRPVTRSFDVFFDLRLNKQLSKQSWGWWSETPSWSLWRHCNDWWKSQTHNWCHKQYYKVNIVIYHSHRWWKYGFTLTVFETVVLILTLLWYLCKEMRIRNLHCLISQRNIRVQGSTSIKIYGYKHTTNKLDENIKQWYKIIEIQCRTKVTLKWLCTHSGICQRP